MNEQQAAAWPQPGFTITGVKHTPGPWFFNGSQIRRNLEHAVGGSFNIGEIRSDGVSLASEQLANGRLMASAPILLDLAAELEAYTEAAMQDAAEEGDEASRIVWQERLAHCRAVIEVATGVRLS